MGGQADTCYIITKLLAAYKSLYHHGIRQHLVLASAQVRTGVEEVPRVQQRPRPHQKVRAEHVSPVLPPVRQRDRIQEVGLASLASPTCSSSALINTSLVAMQRCSVSCHYDAFVNKACLFSVL